MTQDLFLRGLELYYQRYYGTLRGITYISNVRLSKILRCVSFLFCHLGIRDEVLSLSSDDAT